MSSIEWLKLFELYVTMLIFLNKRGPMNPLQKMIMIHNQATTTLKGKQIKPRKFETVIKRCRRIIEETFNPVAENLRLLYQLLNRSPMDYLKPDS